MDYSYRRVADLVLPTGRLMFTFPFVSSTKIVAAIAMLVKPNLRASRSTRGERQGKIALNGTQAGMM